MKSKTTLILIFLSSFCMAQQKYKERRDPEAHAKPAWRLVEQHNLPSVYASYLILGESDIESQRILTGEEGKKIFGSKGKTSGPVVKLKPTTELISLDGLLKIYNVKGKNLGVVVDGLDVKFPNDLYASKFAVQYVKISEHPRIKEKVIYIRTFMPLPNLNDY